MAVRRRGTEPGRKPARSPRGTAEVCRTGRPQRSRLLPDGPRARPDGTPGRGNADVSPQQGTQRTMIEVVVDDLAFVEADAILRPADDTLAPLTPAMKRLDLQAGARFATLCQVQSPLD